MTSQNRLHGSEKLKSATTLHWLCVAPTPYNDFLFQSLHESGQFRILVHYLNADMPTHPWKRRIGNSFPSRFMNQRFGLDQHFLRHIINDQNALFVFGDWSKPATIISVLLAVSLGRKFAFWTDTPNMHRNRNLAKSIARQIWLDFSFSKARAVLGTGRVALEVLEKMGCTKDKLVNFPCFIDLNTFSPILDEAINSEKDRPFDVVASGRLENSQKRYDVAIRAVSIAKNRLQRQIRLRIAGEGRDRQSYECLAAELGIRENVELLGWLEADQLPSFYRSGNVFVHTAAMEPYGVSVLEAMACGLPILGSDSTAAVIDRVVHGVNGLIHRTGDAEQLAEHICSIADPLHFKTMGAAARRTAEEWPASRASEIIATIG